MRRNNKYNSQKCSIGNEVFDSRREARRYSELCLLEQAGQIKNLQRQVKFVLIPAQKESFVIPKKDGTLKLSMRVSRDWSLAMLRRRTKSVQPEYPNDKTAQFRECRRQ